MAVVDQLLEHLRAALSDAATPEMRAAGAVACRHLLGILEPGAASSSTAAPGPAAPPAAAPGPAAAAALFASLPEPVRIFVEALGRNGAPVAGGTAAAPDPLGAVLDSIIGRYGHLLPQDERDRVRAPVGGVPMPPWFGR